jgi:hypothetical protein
MVRRTPMANVGNRGNTAQLEAAQRCTKLRTNRQPCKAFAVRGTEPPACRRHTGKKLETVRAEVAIREDALRWGLGDSKTDPGELLLRLVAQAAIRADAYAAELVRVVEECEGDLKKALTGDSYTSGGEGSDPVKTGEYIRAITKLEADERDRAANFATKAVAAGLAERQVHLAELQGAMIAGVIKAILGDLNLTPEQQAQAGKVVPQHLRLVA